MAKDDFKFRRGDPVIDVITGFKGYITGRADYITKCNQYQIEPPVDEKGQIVQGAWFDEPCLVLDKSRTRIILDHATNDDPPG